MNRFSVKKYSVILGILFIYALPAYAGFEISEIMYDVDGTDTDREWVEVQNTGSSSDDLSQWFFFSGNTKHALVPDTSSLVPAGGYAVIAQKASKFKTDYPNFSGLLFDSSWTGLSNTGDSVGLKDSNLTLVSSVAYTSSMGAGGDGNSLQKTSSGFTPGAPTPGAGPSVSQSTNASSQTSTGGAGGIGSPSSQVILTPLPKKETEVPKISTEIVTKNVVIARVPFEIRAITTGYSREPLTRGKFVWNFGDGMIEQDFEAKKIMYTYEYTGEYVLTLSYFKNYYDTEPSATDRMVIKVIEGGVVINSVGSSLDSYIEIENTSTYEIPLSGWILKGAIHSFVLPEGTIILPGKKLKLSPHRTFFDAADTVHIDVQNPAGEIVSTFPKIVEEKEQSVRVRHTIPSSSVSYGSVNKTESTEVVDLNTLGAQAANANIPVSNSMLAWLGLGGLIVLGSAATFFIRKPHTDTDHLERTLRAEDMTIIE